MTLRLLGCSAIALVLPFVAYAQDRKPDDPLTDIIVTGRISDADSRATVTGAGVSAPDAAKLAARLPGADVAANGPLSGRLQYRGLSNDRLLVRIDGQRFQTGSPNAMDPPLHYAPAPLVDHVTVDRGVSPVRDGPGLGGGFDAALKTVDFTGSDRLAPHADLGGGYRSVDNGRSVGGVAGAANDRFRVGVMGSHEEGDDRRFPGGTVRDTAYSRDTYGVQAGMKTGAGELTLELREQDTGHAGTPALPMDILFFHTTFANARAKLDLSENLHLDAVLGYANVRHQMDNFSLRPAPKSPKMFRLTDVGSDAFTGHANFTLGDPDSHIGFGVDFETDDRNATITNPNNAQFVVDSLPGIVKTRAGAYVEWRGTLGPVAGEVGARYDHHEMTASRPLIGPVLPGPARMLARRFIAADRDWQDDTVDVVARFWSEQGDFTPRLTLARKTRAPNAVERFSWLPIKVSGGLADGNVYVGDVSLEPETAWIAEAGVDWRSADAYARPAIYYRRIDDYVQGVPYDATPGTIDTTVEKVANVNGDPTPLRFANVDAEIYGADIDFGARIAGALRFDGTATYVRGKRRDIDDNLYRIAPPNLRLGLSWSPGPWALTIEGVGYAAQHDVAVTNGEQRSDGYVIGNVVGEVTPMAGIALSAGVENLFDNRYAPHLAGYNRVADSDVPQGARLPAPGRSAFIRLRLSL